MPEDTILCWTWPKALRDLLPADSNSRHVTVKDCNDWLNEEESGRRKLAEFFRQRLSERYIDPVERMEPGDKNGFLIMAISCLLIETFESFRQGWESTESKGRSPLAFCYFFDQQERFHGFKGYGQHFYKHVRCGILHQGETTGGWSIRREGKLLDPFAHKINATMFHRLVAEVVNEYANGLSDGGLLPEVWNKFAQKVRATIKNCEARS
jgi:hypothetical protein